MIKGAPILLMNIDLTKEIRNNLKVYHLNFGRAQRHDRNRKNYLQMLSFAYDMF